MAPSPVRLIRCVCLISFAILAVASTSSGATEKTPASSHIPQPTCSKSGGLPRVVGQYEGWSIDRDCQPFVPEQIPKGIYTHLNYAYANIDPISFEVRPGYLRDPDMYRRFTRLKRRDPNLKVSIAIGDALDPDQIARTFSDIASSESGQRTFFDSLLSFLATYDFDGVDLNLKLPSSPEGNATNEACKNLPDLVSNLRQALKSSGGRDHLSITLSMPDWQLQQCNVTALEKNADFLVLSSYTSRNTEDESMKCLNGHTNLTDTENTLQLLWDEGVKPNHVILGTLFNGVGFTAMESTCLEPGCLHASGSDPQSCSQEVGVMSTMEIEDVIRRTGKTPVLHVDAAVQVLAFDDDQWVAYDDEETLKIKAEYAQSRCLGGVMAWVSQDSPEGHLTAALSQAIGKPNVTNTEQGDRKIEARLSRNGADTVLRHKQCMWSNCGDQCPAGYSNVRNDADFEDANLGPLTKSTMVDPTGCEDSSERLWCCPTLDMPKCLWSGFEHDGICTSSCPDGSVEIASSSGYCENGGYAAACCDDGDDDSNSMMLYHTCSWSGKSTSGGFTNCGESCPDGLSLVAQSQSGSGGVQCNVVGVSESEGHPATYSTRSYCCDKQDYNIKWEFCSKGGTNGNTKETPGHCPGDCPEGRHRVALDSLAPECSSGAASTCCVPQANTLNTDLPENVLGQAEALDLFLSDPQAYCVNETTDSSPERRQVENSLEQRDIILQHPAVLSEVENLVSDMLDSIASHNQIDAWDSGIEEDFPFLRFDSLESYMDQFPNRTSFADYNDFLRYHGMDYGGVRDVACSLSYYNSRSGQELGSGDAPKPLVCHCSDEIVCEAGDKSCVGFVEDDDASGADDEDDDDDGHIDELRRRGLDESEILHILYERATKKNKGPRGGERRPYKYNFKSADGSTSFVGTMYSHTYRMPRKWPDNSPIWNRGYALPAVDSSMSADLVILSGANSWGAISRATEHIFQLGFPRDVVAALATGVFRGNSENSAHRTVLSIGALDPGFIHYVLNGRSAQNPDMTGMSTRKGAHTDMNIERLYWTLGTIYNGAHFVITSQALNSLKSTIWNGDNPVDDDEMKKIIAAMKDDKTVCEVICKLRKVNSILLYFNDPDVHAKFADISNDFRNELLRQYREYNPAGSSDDQKKVTDAYDEILQLELNLIKRTVSDFVTLNAERIREKLKGETAQWAKEAIELGDNFENMAVTAQMTTSGFDGLP